MSSSFFTPHTLCVFVCLLFIYYAEYLLHTVWWFWMCAGKEVNYFTVRHMSVQCFNISAYKSVAIRVIGLGVMQNMFSYQRISIYGSFLATLTIPLSLKFHRNPQLKSDIWAVTFFLTLKMSCELVNMSSFYWSFETKAVACGILSSTQTTL